jgi:hypothetical protein
MLTKKPCENWFERLFAIDGVNPCFMIELIDWILGEVKYDKFS